MKKNIIMIMIACLCVGTVNAQNTSAKTTKNNTFTNATRDNAANITIQPVTVGGIDATRLASEERAPIVLVSVGMQQIDADAYNRGAVNDNKAVNQKIPQSRHPEIDTKK